MRQRIPLQKIVRLIGIVLTVIVVTLIIVLSFIPSAEYPHISWIPFADKGSHMLAYAALGFSFFLVVLQIPGFGKAKRDREKPHSTLHLSSWSGRAVTYTLLLGTVLGASIEMVQPLFGRQREWLDLAADLMGLVVGLAIVMVMLKLVGSYFTNRPWLYDPNWEEEVEEALKADK